METGVFALLYFFLAWVIHKLVPPLAKSQTEVVPSRTWNERQMYFAYNISLVHTLSALIFGILNSDL